MESPSQEEQARRLVARLEPGHVLTPEDVAVLTCLAEAPWQRRQRRLDERDAVIRQARQLLPQGKQTVASRMIELALRRYLSHGMHTASLAPSHPERFRAMIEIIARLNDGKVIAWRQIAAILGGSRSQ
jgi:alkylated DNA nucleotide flippase Atl1